MDSFEICSLFREKEHLEFFRYSSILDEVTRERFIARIKEIEEKLSAAAVAAS